MFRIKSFNLKEKIKKIDYLKQRAFVLDRRSDIILGYAPDFNLQAYESKGMVWFAYQNDELIKADTLQDLFYKLDLPHIRDWSKAEKIAKTRIALGGKPIMSIDEFVDKIH
jgi:hypothetical protein